MAKKSIKENFNINGVRAAWTNHLFTPDTEGDYATGKYSVELFFPKSDKETVDAVRKAIANDAMEAIRNGVLTKAAAQLIGKAANGEYDDSFGYPLRDGDKRNADYAAAHPDQEGPKYPELVGCYYILATSRYQPRLYDLSARQYEADDPQARRDIYSGCVVNARLTAVAYAPSNVVRNGGVSIWLDAVQKAADGERLGGSDGFSAMPGADAGSDGFAGTGAAPGSEPSDADMYAQMGM